MKNSAKQLHAYFNTLPVALCRTTVAGKLVMSNTAFKRLLGYRADTDLSDRDVHQWFRRPAVRQDLLREVQASPRVVNFSIDLISTSDDILPCRVAVRGVYDDRGILSGLDEVWRLPNRSTPAEKKLVEESESGLAADPNSALILTLDLQGRIIELKGGTLEQIEFNPEVLRGRLISDVVRVENPHLLDLFLAGVLDNEHAQGIISLVDRVAGERRINFAARLIKSGGQPRRIECVVRDPWVAHRVSELNQAKFDGVVEMAGGIAHRLNQPLMVLNNRLGEILDATQPHQSLHGKLVKVRETLAEINDIARKVGGINKYAPMEYVGGIKIVDIDQSSIGKDYAP